jgi:hypothetical protein
MQCEFKDSHDTLDELIAYHGVENIVRVKYVMTSDVIGLTTLSMMVRRDRHYYKLRYIGTNLGWGLQKIAVSAMYYQEHPGIDKITYIFDKIRAADIVKARV